MKKPSEQDIQNAVDKYSGKSEDELLKDLCGFDIDKESFDSFSEMLIPMLNDEQRKKLEDIGRAIGCRGTGSSE